MTEGKSVTEKISEYIISFFIYSVVIWFFNAVSTWLVYPEGGFDGGLLMGPYAIFPALMIMGVMLIFNLIKIYGKPKDINPTPVLLVIISIVLFMGTEYSGSVIYELITGEMPWDYSLNIYNINGRICWENSIFLTVFELVCVYVAQPFFTKSFEKFPISARIIAAMAVVAIILTDIICTVIK